VGLEFLAQLLVVLDDAVVHDREAVAREVRMSIALARYSVRGPARVRNAGATLDRQFDQGLLERAHLADRTQALQMPVGVEHGYAGGIVTAVFEPLEALDQYRHDVAIGDPRDYSTHISAAPVMAWAAF
jgi:hypothetical protein